MLFSPLKIGPLELRNRSIRAAAFEGMSNKHDVTNELIASLSQLADGGKGVPYYTPFIWGFLFLNLNRYVGSISN